MINKLKPKSEFSKNVLTLMTGTTIAQAIPIAISPILTRLYTPEDFGVFALFITIVSIFGSIVNGRYELAIMLPRKDENAINILALGFLINIIISIFLLFLVIVFHDNILSLLNNNQISTWLYLIPFSVFLIGCFNLLNYFNNRKKQYKDLAQATVYKSLGNVVVQLSFGWLKYGVVGLIGGQIFSQIISNTKLFFNITNLNLFSSISRVKIVFFYKKYFEFALYSSGGALLGVGVANLHYIFISNYFASSTLFVGLIFLSQRIISAPLSVISSSFSQVFFQKLTDIKKLSELKKIYIKFIQKLFIISFLLFIIVYSIPSSWYIVIFGDRWEGIDKIVKILIIWYAISFVSSSVSFIYTRLERQKEMFYFDIFHLFVISIFFLITYIYKLEFYLFLELYVFLKVIIYLIAIFLALRFLDE